MYTKLYMALENWWGQKPTEVEHLEKVIERGIDLANANGVPEDEVDDWVLNQIALLEAATGTDIFGDAANAPDPFDTGQL